MGKKDLWALTKDSLHVKFYQWMWGIYAPEAYKTACPYYWNYGFSLVFLLPFIILSKLGAWLFKPLRDYFETQSILKKADDKHIWLLRAKNATTDIELYDVFKSKCFQYYRYDTVFEEVYQKIMDGYKAHREVLRKAKDLHQAKIDAFKYGIWGTILTYVIGLVILGLIGWGLYTLAYLITWPEFKSFTFTTLIIIGTPFVLFAMIAGGSTVYDKYVCDTWVGNLRPLKWFAWPFKMLWTLALMFVDMIKSVYTKSCPTIDWK